MKRSRATTSRNSRRPVDILSGAEVCSLGVAAISSVLLAEAYVARSRRRAAPWGHWPMNSRPTGQSHWTALTAGLQAWAGEIERALLALQACGALSAKFDPKSLSLLLLSTIQGGLLFAKLNGSAEALAKGLDQLIPLIRNQE